MSTFTCFSLLFFFNIIDQTLLDNIFHTDHSILHPNDVEAWKLYDSMLDVNQDIYTKPTPLMIVEAGYNVETHQIVTNDGYILSLHRIPNYEASSQPPAVFLQHGLMSSSADWVISGPDHALAFLLADSGYDVWMGNFRGNTYSKDHIDPDITKEDYWSFTWDEHAQYDLPAMLSHVMEVTGKTRYHYIGHSMGTLSYYTACNYHKWVCDNTKLMVGYGPHTVIPNLFSPLFRIMSEFSDDIHWLLDHAGLYDFAPSNWLVRYLADEVCDRKRLKKEICGNILFLVAGYNSNEMNSTLLPYIVGHTPAGTSSLNMIHYSQSVTNGGWAGYDWKDADKNMARWNSVTPPVYQYDNITAPVALYWSDNDWLVVPTDVATLANKLPNLVLNYEMEEKAYTHLDFIWGIHNYHDLYNHTLKLMEKY